MVNKHDLFHFFLLQNIFLFYLFYFFANVENLFFSNSTEAVITDNNITINNIVVRIIF